MHQPGFPWSAALVLSCSPEASTEARSSTHTWATPEQGLAFQTQCHGASCRLRDLPPALRWAVLYVWAPRATPILIITLIPVECPALP